MSKTKARVPQKLQPWVEARKRYRLSNAHIQMARELGLNPKKFGKIANQEQEPWKVPLPEFIEEIYFKRFGKDRPDQVRSIEELVRDTGRKKAKQKERKLARSRTVSAEEREGDVTQSLGVRRRLPLD